MRKLRWPFGKWTIFTPNPKIVETVNNLTKGQIMYHSIVEEITVISSFVHFLCENEKSSSTNFTVV